MGPKTEHDSNCNKIRQSQPDHREKSSLDDFGQLQADRDKLLSMSDGRSQAHHASQPLSPLSNNPKGASSAGDTGRRTAQSSQPGQLAIACEILAVLSAATSIVVLSRTWHLSSNTDTWPDNCSAVISSETKEGSWFLSRLPSTLPTDSWSPFAISSQHWIINSCHQHLNAQTASIMVYTIAVIFLTNRARHHHRKGDLMLLAVSASAFLCAIVRRRTQFLSSVLVEFVPSAILLSEVVSLLLDSVIPRTSEQEVVDSTTDGQTVKQCLETAELDSEKVTTDSSIGQDVEKDEINRPTTETPRAVEQFSETQPFCQESRRTGEDNSVKREVPTTRIVTKQPQRKTLFCNFCNDQPSGFHGDHELHRHIERHHAPVRRVWICRDNSEDGTFLSNCKACRNRKTYGANYNAAAHLRRAHFNPCKNRRSGRGGVPPSNFPSMEYLKDWMYQTFESNMERGATSTLPGPDEQPYIVRPSDIDFTHAVSSCNQRANHVSAIPFGYDGTIKPFQPGNWIHTGSEPTAGSKQDSALWSR